MDIREIIRSKTRLLRGISMSDAITDIESGIDKIEALIKTLRDERDAAKAEAAAMKRDLDDREMELLQTDEEMAETKRGYEEQLAESRQAREDMETRLSDVASKVKNLMALVAEYSHNDSSQEQATSSENRT
jgi:chromosome segregation ATPase